MRDGFGSSFGTAGGVSWRASWGRWLLWGFLALPAAEIVTFVLVALAIGFVPAFALGLLTSFLGAALLRSIGGTQVAEFRGSVARGRVGAVELGNGGLVRVLAGVLLLIPGFLTDALGGLLLIAPFRRWLVAAIVGRIGGKPAAQDGVIDLDPDDWTPVPQGKLEIHETAPEDSRKPPPERMP